MTKLENAHIKITYNKGFKYNVIGKLIDRYSFEKLKSLFQRIEPQLIESGYDLNTLKFELNSHTPRKNKIINHCQKYLTSYYGFLDGYQDVIMQHPSPSGKYIVRDVSNIMDREVFNEDTMAGNNILKSSFYFFIALKPLNQKIIWLKEGEEDEILELLKEKKEEIYFCANQILKYEEQSVISKFFDNDFFISELIKIPRKEKKDIYIRLLRKKNVEILNKFYKKDEYSRFIALKIIQEMIEMEYENEFLSFFNIFAKSMLFSDLLDCDLKELKLLIKDNKYERKFNYIINIRGF